MYFPIKIKNKMKENKASTIPQVPEVKPEAVPLHKAMSMKPSFLTNQIYSIRV